MKWPGFQPELRSLGLGLIVLFSSLFLSSCGPKQALASDNERPLAKRGIRYEWPQSDSTGTTPPKESKKRTKVKLVRQETPVDTSSSPIDTAEAAAELALPDADPKYGFALQNPKLYNFIRKWEGTPHRMGGNSTRGVDCSGLVCNLYTEVYDHRFVHRSSRDIFTETTPIEKEALEEGDLVFFKINGRRIDHVGVYLGDGKFVHSSSSRGVMVSSLEEAYYQSRFYSGGRVAP